MIAAVLTPPDVISQLSLALPLMVLYEGSIWSVRIVEKKARAEAAAKAAAKPQRPQRSRIQLRRHPRSRAHALSCETPCSAWLRRMTGMSPCAARAASS